MSTTAAGGDVAALQGALAAEHAAVYGYGVVGAALADAREEAALAAYTSHLVRRDRLELLLAEAGATPVGSEAAYALPFPVESAAAAVRLAVTIEERVAASYGELVAGSSDAAVRRYAAAALQGAAVRAAYWRGRGVPFPGLPERG